MEPKTSPTPSPPRTVCAGNSSPRTPNPNPNLTTMDSDSYYDIPDEVPEEHRAQWIAQHEAHRRDFAVRSAAEPFLKKCQEQHEARIFHMLNTLRDAAPSDIAFVSSVAVVDRITAVVAKEVERLPQVCVTAIWRYFAGLWAEVADLNEASLKAQYAAAAAVAGSTPKKGPQ